MSISVDLKLLLSAQPVDLPVFHTVALKLQHLLDTPNFSMVEAIGLANEDQALAGQILKLANSAAYMGRVPTETIKDAVIRLGAQKVCNLAMTASQAGLHVSNNEVVYGFMQSLWEHSYSCAVGGRWLAQNAGCRQYADLAYMAGLLHDLGKLYLLKSMERLHSMGVAQAQLEKDLILEVFSSMHVQEGCRLMQQWNMPETYCNVVANHHDEDFSVDDTVMAIVRFVNAACKVKGLGLVCDQDIDLLALPEATVLAIGQAEVDGLFQAWEDLKTEEAD